MDPRSVEVGRGVAWFGCGWQIFAKNPGVWIVLTVLLIVIFLVLSLIRFGGLVLTLFAPVLAAGLVYGAAELRAGRALQLGHLFQGFRDQATLTPLVILGAVLLGASLLSILIALVFIGDAMRTMMGDPGAGASPMSPGVLVALLLMLTVHLIAALLVYFAVPLVMLQKVAVSDAMQRSMRACSRNVFPLFVFGLIYFVAAVVASIPLGLGWILLLPWSVGMYYCSYVDIFPPG